MAMRRLAACLGVALTLMSAGALADKASGSIRFASEQVLQNADPYFNNLAIGAYLGEHVWDSLLYRNPDTGALVPNLATAWRWIDDRTLELDLREGVRFHDGQPFTADDVVYTLTFIADPRNRIARSDGTLWIGDVEKINAQRVRIHTKMVYPAALAVLASPTFPIHPHRYYAEVGPQGMNTRPIGTGPYRVTQHELGKRMVLERNPDYFSGPKARPRVATVEIRFIPDATTQVAEAVAGGLDLIMNVARDQAEQLRDIPHLKVIASESAIITYLQLNTLPTTPAPPLLDVRVRRAMAHAIDRETIVRTLQGPQGKVMHTECHPVQFGCSDAGAPRYEYDPDKARALLAEAGYANGFELELHAYSRRNEVEAIANYLRAVGIRARLRFLQTSAVVTAVASGRTAVAHFGQYLGITADVSRALPLNHVFTARDVNRDAEVRDLLLRGNSVLDDAERLEAYRQALALISERAYVLPLYAVAQHFVANKDLVFTPHADTMPRFYEMDYR